MTSYDPDGTYVDGTILDHLGNVPGKPDVYPSVIPSASDALEADRQYTTYPSVNPLFPDYHTRLTSKCWVCKGEGISPILIDEKVRVRKSEEGLDYHEPGDDYYKCHMCDGRGTPAIPFSEVLDAEKA